MKLQSCNNRKKQEKQLQGQRRRVSCETWNAWTCSSTLGEYARSLRSCLSHAVAAVYAQHLYLHYSPAKKGVLCGAFECLSGLAKSFCVQPNSYCHITPNITEPAMREVFFFFSCWPFHVCHRCVTATFIAKLAPAERQSLKRSGAKLRGKVAKLIKCQAWRWDYYTVLLDGLAQAK